MKVETAIIGAKCPEIYPTMIVSKDKITFIVAETFNQIFHCHEFFSMFVLLDWLN
jgi:hypothetical protein